MLISIIIPVYNVEAYIKRCFESVVKQAYTPLECIFVDDATPDNSMNILNTLIAGYNGNISFRVLRHEKNEGLSEARNTGIKNAKGAYIYFLDSDDEITEDCIQTLAALAGKYHDVDIVQGNVLWIPCKEKYNIYDIIPSKFPEWTDNRLWLKRHFFISPRIPVTAWNKLIKRGFIVENNLYFRKGIIHEDDHWMFFAAKKIRTMAFSTHYCYNYHIIPGSIMRSECNNYRKLHSWFLIINDMLLNIDIEILREERTYIYSALRRNLYKLNAAPEDKPLLLECRNVVKTLIKDAYTFCNFIHVLGLAILLLPYPLYRNFICRKVSGLLLSNWRTILTKIARRLCPIFR
jgi:glycosyltransferase involved in cell wall biosynthesis